MTRCSKVGHTQAAQTGSNAHFSGCESSLVFSELLLLTFDLSCVAHLAHQPPPAADLLKALQNSGAIRSDVVEVLVEEILELVSSCSEILPAVYSRLHRFVCFRKPEAFLASGNTESFFRIIVANLRVPLSEHERLLLMQLDGNLRLGHSGQHHEDLSGIQVEISTFFSIFDDNPLHNYALLSRSHCFRCITKSKVCTTMKMKKMKTFP